MPRGRKKKMPFEDLDQDYKDNVAAMTDEEVRQELSKIGINEHENKENKKLDQDLESKKVVYNEAGEIYREASKANKLRTAYCYDMLAARGKL